MHKEIFDSLGLDREEIALYQTILKTGDQSATEVAKSTGVKRTTVYSMARSLVEKGLLNEDTTRRPALFQLADPEDLLSQVEKEKKLLKSKEKSLIKIAGELSKIQAKNKYPVPTVRFIQEQKIKSFLNKNAKIWDQSAISNKEFTWWGFQDPTFLEYYGDWIEKYWAKWDKRMDLKLLSNRASVEVQFAGKNKHNDRRHIKFWGEALDFYSTTWVAGDYVIMINTRTAPFYLIEIHDKLMAHDQHEMFRNLWKMI